VAEKVVAPRRVAIVDQPDAFANEGEQSAQMQTVLKPAASGFSFWTRLFLSSLGGLITMAIGLWFWRLVDDLMKASPYFGWAATGLIALGALALIVLTIRELRGLRSLSVASDMLDEAEAIVLSDDGAKAKAIVRRLIAYQAKDPSTAAQRQAMEAHLGEIIDGRGMLTLADRMLLLPRDEQARIVIASAAKRVSVVTAISPRAIVDILFVAAQSVMLTRRIADIYGARPGTLGFLRLGRRILGHLAITGGVAISDSVLSQLVGHGVAARLSAKLGEGVLNGLLTARVGLAAVAACRPLPFLAGEEPKLQDVAADILTNPLGKTD
jgi:putative membrane protein